jgi:hypothetical protein
MSRLIENLLIKYAGDNKIIFSGYFREKMFFGTNESGKFEIMNSYSFYDFEQEHILKYLNEKIKR